MPAVEMDIGSLWKKLHRSEEEEVQVVRGQKIGQMISKIQGYNIEISHKAPSPAPTSKAKSSPSTISSLVRLLACSADYFDAASLGAIRAAILKSEISSRAVSSILATALVRTDIDEARRALSQYLTISCQDLNRCRNEIVEFWNKNASSDTGSNGSGFKPAGLSVRFPCTTFFIDYRI